MVFVQELATAKYDGMPRSAVDAGCADVIASAEELPGKILAYLQHSPKVVAQRVDVDLADKEQSDLEKVIIVLRSADGS